MEMCQTDPTYSGHSTVFDDAFLAALWMTQCRPYSKAPRRSALSIFVLLFDSR